MPTRKSPILVEDNELETLLSKNSVDPTTFAANQAVRNLHFLRDANGNLITIATIGVNPNTSPIKAGVTGNTNVAVYDSGFVNSAGILNETGVGTYGLVASPNSALALLQVNDTATTTYTSPTLPTAVNWFPAFKSVWIHINATTVTGTSATVTLNAIDPYTGDGVSVNNASNSQVSFTLATGTKYDILWHTDGGTLASLTAVGSPITTNAAINGPLLPFQLVVTKASITVYSVKYSVTGFV